MENKYYTPKIEEFRVGFEFEFQGIDNNWNPTGWDKVKVNIGHDKNFGLYTLEHIDSVLNNEDIPAENHIRVKCLSREDIESLGFFDYKKSICDWYKIEGKFEDSFSEYGYWTKIRIIHCKDNNKIRILAYEYSWDEKETVLFAGKIKNKSEFKDILEKLNIV